MRFTYDQSNFELLMMLPLQRQFPTFHYCLCWFGEKPSSLSDAHDPLNLYPTPLEAKSPFVCGCGFMVEMKLVLSIVEALAS